MQSATLQPDVILMDLMMPIMDGVEAIRQISVASHNRILALTSLLPMTSSFLPLRLAHWAIWLRIASRKTL